MIDKKLKEALELLGGKAVLQDGDQYYILMSVQEFKRIKQEKIEGLTKQELIDKINSDIALWKMKEEDRLLNLEDIEKLETEKGAEESIHYEAA